MNTHWQRSFFTLWGLQQLSWLGSSVAGFALVWWLTQTTGSATVLAIGTLLTLLPGVLLGPFAGALIDRWDRRWIMIVADSTVALLSAWLVYLFWRGTVQLGHIYAIMFARAVGGVFHWPAMQASTSLMVPEEHLPRVSGLNQAFGGAVNIVAPPVSAFLIGVLSLPAILALDVITALLAVAPLFWVHIPRPPHTVRSGAKTSLWTDVRAGICYLWGWPGLLIITIGSMISQFVLAPAISLVPILVTRHYGGGVAQLAWMNSMWGGGLVAGGLLLGVWGGFRRRIVTMLVSTIGFGLGILVVGLMPAPLWGVALGGMFLAAGLLSISNGSAFALLQQTVDPEMQGRVFTLIMSLSNGLTPLSMAIAGPIVDVVGVQFWFALSGLVSFILSAVCFSIPVVMNLEKDRAARAAVEGPASAAVQA